MTSNAKAAPVRSLRVQCRLGGCHCMPNRGLNVAGGSHILALRVGDFDHLCAP